MSKKTTATSSPSTYLTSATSEKPIVISYKTSVDNLPSLDCVPVSLFLSDNPFIGEMYFDKNNNKLYTYTPDGSYPVNYSKEEKPSFSIDENIDSGKWSTKKKKKTKKFNRFKHLLEE